MVIDKSSDINNGKYRYKLLDNLFSRGIPAQKFVIKMDCLELLKEIVTK